MEQTDGRIEGEVPYRPFPQTPLPLWDKMAEDKEGWRTARKICISGRFFPFSAAGREVQESEPAAKKLFILLQELCRRGSCGTELRIRPGETPDPAVRNMPPPAKASFGSGIRRGKILFGIGSFRRPKSEGPRSRERPPITFNRSGAPHEINLRIAEGFRKSDVKEK
ncbi:MAG: hypothetical protein C6P37_08950 [Caldibacillus debilis]|uniref:Uncharacterized protein n=1 Tax=Caldibacillus debilis TaxID=301148 RepID=A0A3E0K538_9BACI|nr:MAG: hypothetical protein C6P37_08950 [Caldibacillus debilis]